MARKEQVSSNPEIRQRKQEVKERATRKRTTSSRVLKKDAAKLEREAKRQRTLEEAEAEQESNASDTSTTQLADTAAASLLIAFSRTAKKGSSDDGEKGKL